MDQKDFLYAMKVRGYTIFENVLKKTTTDRILKIMSSLPQDTTHNGIVRNLFDKLPVDCISEVIENEVVLPRMDSLLDNTFIIHSFNSSPLRPGIKGAAADFHRDAGRYIAGYDYAFNVLYTITDFTRVSGTTLLVPGSHLIEERPSDKYISENTIELEAPAGSALIFNANLWHAQGENKSDKLRLGITITCKRSFMRQQFDFPRALSSELVAMLSERGRQLLGFYVRMPTSLEEYLLPEEERLYKANQG
jgi:ectoine hydroxylase-related dioxygenase (phytanoyl-CoA dioxygenase family)